MKNISIEEDSKFKECLEIAKKAKKLRYEAKKVEQEAVKEFRSFYEKNRDVLKNQAQKLEADVKTSEEKIPEMIDLFCQQKGHTFSYRKVITKLSEEIEHTFLGSVYPDETYKTCVICGRTNAIWSRKLEYKDLKQRHYDRNYNTDEAINLIKKDLLLKKESDETAEWMKTAQKIVDLTEEIDKQKAELIQIQSRIKSLCSLFGHDVEEIRFNPTEYKCTCCGKQMSADEYYADYRKAKYRDGIIVHHFNSYDSPAPPIIR